MHGLFCTENPILENNPKDVNASIGGEAVFQCSFKNISNCNLTFVRWFINGKDVEQQQELKTYTSHFSCEVTDDIYIGITTLTLPFSKSSDLQWNYSEVHCNGLSHVDVKFNIHSASALLRIQGIPGPFMPYIYSKIILVCMDVVCTSCIYIAMYHIYRFVCNGNVAISV